MLEQVILAIDLSTKEEIKNLLEKLNPKPKILKLGFQAVLGMGLKEALDLVKEYSPASEIFLDLKLHDIPNTVSSGIKSLFLNSYKLKFLTLHTLAGFESLSRSKELVNKLKLPVELVGVTLLTSHGLKELELLFGIKNTAETVSYIYRLIEFSREAGIKYFVCSALEAQLIKEKFPAVKLICPGIRLPELSKTQKEDQSRILSPKEALEFADLIVIGRPIYQAENPQKNWEILLDSLS